MTTKISTPASANVPGERLIKRDEFAYFDWGTLAVGDKIEGIGKVETDVERMLIQETMPQLVLDCLQELSTMDDEPQVRLNKMVKLAGRR